jgi:hypothetical protein
MSIRIDIPGVGTVEVTNAATEETLEKILSSIRAHVSTDNKAIEDWNSKLKDAVKAQQALTRNIAETNNELTKNLDSRKAADSLRELSESSQLQTDNNQQTVLSSQTLVDSFDRLTATSDILDQSLSQFNAGLQASGLTELGKSALAAASSLGQVNTRPLAQAAQAMSRNNAAVAEGTRLTAASNDQSKLATVALFALEKAGSAAWVGLLALGRMFVSTAKNVWEFSKELAKTALAVSAAWTTNIDQIAANPIGAAVSLVSTGIDLAASAMIRFTDVLQAGVGAVPVIGAIPAAMRAAVEMIQETLKAANEFMGEQLQKMSESFFRVSQIGFVSARGLDDLAKMSVESGLGIESFGRVVASSREAVNNMGVTVSGAAARLSGGLRQLTTITGSSGQNLRSELMGLGIGFEEQGEIMAEYSAIVASTGQLKKTTDEEIARGTASYARDLKILSDITGEDARKRMQEARTESMRASLMAKLGPEQQKAFQTAYAGLARFGPEAQAALVQKIALGEVIDPAVALNTPMMEMINKLKTGIDSGAENMAEITMSSMSEAAEKIRTSSAGLAGALDTAALVGASGPIATAANMMNKMLTFLPGQEEIDKTVQNVNEATRLQGEITRNVADIHNKTIGMQVAMQQLAESAMSGYSSVLATTVDGVTSSLTKIVNTANEIGAELAAGKSWSDIAKDRSVELAEDAAKKVAEAFDSLMTFFKDTFVGLIEAMLRKVLPGWMLSGSGERVQTQEGSAAAVAAAARESGPGSAEHQQALADSQARRQAQAQENDRRALEAADAERAAKLKAAQERHQRIESGEEKLSWWEKPFYKAPPAATPAATPADTTTLNSGGTRVSQALGGIVTGPKEGFGAILHDTEAVVPLPNGREIPVQLQTPPQDVNAVSAAQHQLESQLNKITQLVTLTEDMLSVLKEQRDINRNLLHNSI